MTTIVHLGEVMLAPGEEAEGGVCNIWEVRPVGEFDTEESARVLAGEMAEARGWEERGDGWWFPPGATGSTPALWLGDK